MPYNNNLSVTPWSVVETERLLPVCFGLFLNLVDGDGTFLRNVGKIPSD